MKTGTTALEQLLTHRMRFLHKLCERSANERFQAALGITAPEARLIAMVAAEGPISVTALARETHLEKSRTSRAVAAMMARGLMRRATSDQDRRLVLASLTAKGGALNRRAVLLARKWDYHLLGSLGEKERELLNRAIDMAIKAALAY